ncbi:uracil phosphoribosyltransferase [Candidatus Haliotispira prima]|uniref:Uracil phosphoribosyltransferase n=1 Tax=Candidatus Haliotispira prima TaxID=3034016 RepID=A0ABY8MEM3_9SPIO|nr:uracil phosphoribosyltransferase [Candidatus Haliotispira prima]
MTQTYSIAAGEIESALSKEDREALREIAELYQDQILPSSAQLAGGRGQGLMMVKPEQDAVKEELIRSYELLGKKIEAMVGREPNLHVYSFDTENEEQRGEVSRLIAKLRSTQTRQEEFTYYIQRAYELLFKQVFIRSHPAERNYILAETPVTDPCPNYAVHRVPSVDRQIEKTVMCVMLRGALLPSMILSKEIEEYSSSSHMTPFALFRIKRDEEGPELNYVIDLDHSYFRKEDLADAHLLFADPMHATGGSILTILRYLEEMNIRPRKVSLIHVITNLSGAINIARVIPWVSLYTLWMDPMLNEHSYIMPGLGDAGDRLNGVDLFQPRNLIQLIADYGSNISSLYRRQIRCIEQSVLG